MNDRTGDASGEPILDADELKIARLHLEKGDVLVVRVDTQLSDKTSKRIHDTLRPKVMEGVQILVIDQNIELSVLTRAEIDAKAA